MSNIKQIRIDGTVPFNWLTPMSHEEGPKLTDDDIAALASALMTPTTGLRFSYQHAGYIPHMRDGREVGQTAMYHIRITGRDGMSWKFLSRVAGMIAHVGTVIRAEAKDVEDRSVPQRWESLATTYLDMTELAR
jgi:hypothetical protein